MLNKHPCSGAYLTPQVKMLHQGGQTVMIGGRTVRLARPGATLIKSDTVITGPGGKHKQCQPPSVSNVKTSQYKQVLIMPYGVQGQVLLLLLFSADSYSRHRALRIVRLVQTFPSQGAAIVNLVNAQGRHGRGDFAISFACVQF
jgi:hypothetical protein